MPDNSLSSRRYGNSDRSTVCEQRLYASSMLPRVLPTLLYYIALLLAQCQRPPGGGRDDFAGIVEAGEAPVHGASFAQLAGQPVGQAVGGCAGGQQDAQHGVLQGVG